MKKSYLLWLLAVLLTRAAQGQTADPPLHGNILEELRETYSTLHASRISTGVLLDQVVPLSRPERFAGQGDTTATWATWR